MYYYVFISAQLEYPTSNQPVNYCHVCDSERNTELQNVYWRPPKNLQRTILLCYNYYDKHVASLLLQDIWYNIHIAPCNMDIPPDVLWYDWCGLSDNNALSAPLLPTIQHTVYSKQAHNMNYVVPYSPFRIAWHYEYPVHCNNYLLGNLQIGNSHFSNNHSM